VVATRHAGYSSETPTATQKSTSGNPPAEGMKRDEIRWRRIVVS
jgi:hypothetical protein